MDGVVSLVCPPLSPRFESRVVLDEFLFSFYVLVGRMPDVKSFWGGNYWF